MLTVQNFSKVNRARSRRWVGPNDPWDALDYAVAFAGEAGEACDAVKKLRRVQTNLESANNPHSYEEAFAAIGDELCDTIAYADLLAEKLGQQLPPPFSPPEAFGFNDYKEADRSRYTVQQASIRMFTSVARACEEVPFTMPVKDYDPVWFNTWIQRTITGCRTIAANLSLDLEECIVTKFNGVSLMKGFPERL